MRKVDWSEKAIKNLAKQVKFIAGDSQSNALKVRDRVLAAIAKLSDRPVGRAGRNSGTYEFYVSKTSLVIVYVLPDDERLTIVRVIHTSRDFKPGAFPPEA